MGVDGGAADVEDGDVVVGVGVDVAETVGDVVEFDEVGGKSGCSPGTTS